MSFHWYHSTWVAALFVRGFLLALVLTMSLSVFGCGSWLPRASSVDEGCQGSVPGDRFNWTFDVDGNGSDDFEIKYSAVGTANHPCSYMYMSVSVRPLGRNRLIGGEAIDELPFGEGRRIDRFNEWSKYSGGLAGISWNRKCGWERKWTGSWLESAGSYLPILVVCGDLEYLGWLSIECSEETGEVTILDSFVSNIYGRSIVTGRSRAFEGR